MLMDGAMGTEIERRGVAVDDRTWSAAAHGAGSNTVREIHADYIAAGARIHITNTFAMSRHVLALDRLEGRFATLNREAVSEFDAAVASSESERRDLWLAGSLSTFYEGSNRGKLPPPSELHRNVANQAAILAAAGVDSFALEMLFDVDVTLAMWRAVADFGLPVILGFTCDDSGTVDSVPTRAARMGAAPVMLDEVLQEVLEAVNESVIIPAIMHSQPETTRHALEVLRRHWDGPVAVYPNSGSMQSVNQDFTSVCSPAEFADEAGFWFREGVNIVGGCCGIGPSHIHAAAAHLQ